MSIITKRGDEGETDLLFNRRIAKSDHRIALLGTMDELNAALGMARVHADSPLWIEHIESIQQLLVSLMGEFATLPQDAELYRASSFSKITSDDVTWLEKTAKEYESQGVRFTGWAVPGAEGSVARASLDVAKTIARRAEHQAWVLHEKGESVSKTARLFLNRLSDFLWILARSHPVK